jgi:hypothetical protein
VFDSAAFFICSPVAGFLTILSGRDLHANLPSPGSVTAPPLATSFVTIADRASKVRFVDALSAFVASANAATS